MSELKGFWSYVHEDDAAEGGRITQLAKDLKAQYEMIACEKIDLFVDRTDLHWGQAWKEAIDLQLASVAFFIPVITPRFFRSYECRRELSTFLSHAENFGVRDLVLPLLYLYPQDFNGDQNEDVLIKLIKSKHWENWTIHRFRNLDDGEYRKNVFRLAKELFDANIKSEQEIIQEVIQTDDISVESLEDDRISRETIRKPLEPEDDSLGIIDQLALSEVKLTQLPDILDSMTNDLTEFTNILRQSTDEVRSTSSGGFSARLLIMKKTANQLKEPIDRIWSRSNLYASYIHDVDVGYRILINKASVEIKDSPSSLPHYCSLFESIRYLSEKSNEMVQGAKDLIKAVSPFEKQSRDMRPVVRRFKEGLTILIESSSMSNDWVELIDETGINCGDLES